MAHVNLLPWRETARQRAKQTFGVQVFIALVIAAALIFAGFTVIKDYQRQQKARNQFLSSQIQVLDAQIKEIDEINAKKESIVTRMKLIQSLHQDRNTAIRVINELSLKVPDGVHILQIEKRGSQLNMRGRAVSNNRVSEFIRAMNDSDTFTQPILREIASDYDATDGPTRYNAFTLSVSIKMPEAPKFLAEGGAQ